MIMTILAHNYPIWWLAQLVAVGILVFLFLRWKPGFLGGKTIGTTLGNTLDAREAQIKEQLAAAERSREEAARIREASQRDIQQAREEANGIVQRAGTTSQAIQQEIETRARQEYDRIIGQARTEIDYERQQAELALQRRAADIVIDAAGQIVQQHLDAGTDQQLIGDSLGNLRGPS
jgi:F-type H+-transporting ATPase subunit b